MSGSVASHFRIINFGLVFSLIFRRSEMAACPSPVRTCNRPQHSERHVAIRADVELTVKNGRILGVDFLCAARGPDSFIPDKQTVQQI
jgi:hypothetical protein